MSLDPFSSLPFRVTPSSTWDGFGTLHLLDTRPILVPQVWKFAWWCWAWNPQAWGIYIREDGAEDGAKGKKVCKEGQKLPLPGMPNLTSLPWHPIQHDYSLPQPIFISNTRLLLTPAQFLSRKRVQSFLSGRPEPDAALLWHRTKPWQIVLKLKSAAALLPLRAVLAGKQAAA